MVAKDNGRVKVKEEIENKIAGCPPEPSALVRPKLHDERRRTGRLIDSENQDLRQDFPMCSTPVNSLEDGNADEEAQELSHRIKIASHRHCDLTRYALPSSSIITLAAPALCATGKRLKLNSRLFSVLPFYLSCASRWRRHFPPIWLAAVFLESREAASTASAGHLSERETVSDLIRRVQVSVLRERAQWNAIPVSTPTSVVANLRASDRRPSSTPSIIGSATHCSSAPSHPCA
ncbi:hypothetical protein C8R45DRAFT_1111681 [Mycena sanguinolenta]|nr:hypothetical protein C8R45DRAFT_1111681 [Mycena sanguinolenta]